MWVLRPYGPVYDTMIPFGKFSKGLERVRSADAAAAERPLFPSPKDQKARSSAAPMVRGCTGVIEMIPGSVVEIERD
ncbi:MAG: hypothetical protein JWN66_2417 [Sphingomonas bacterium]|nr:hypothetical protein [Sphingomonas bacterium]